MLFRSGEEFALFHAAIFLARRKQTNFMPQRGFGCLADPCERRQKYITTLLGAADFVTVPLSWLAVEAKEQQYDFEMIDDWVELLTRHKTPVKMSPLLAFGQDHIPNWVYLWENDYDTLRQLIQKYLKQILDRYGRFVRVWDVVSGIHADNPFNLSFEQVMELTRIAVTAVRQLSPDSTTVLELVAPWGEYFARNPRTIPPLLYAAMCLQSGVNFDAVGLQFRFGADREGPRVRDMMQISSMLDRFANLGKPIHVTAAQVPSDLPLSSAAASPNPGGGQWHQPWTEQTQALWLRDFLAVALSKPFVEAVTWQGLTDSEEGDIPYGGLVRQDMTEKLACKQWRDFRTEAMTPPSTIVDQQARRTPDYGM